MNVQPDTSAKTYSKQEIIINAPAVRVFKLIADINNWKTWQSNVTQASIAGEAREGATFKWKAGGVSFISKLHTVTPFIEIGWTGKTWWINAVHNWYLEEEENGKCKVTAEESLKGFLSGLMNKSLHESMNKNLKELKLAVEMQ
jgi:Polyketide cyclase / dehydrase and lipid transport